ncbi:MAG: TetR/AcrR family transcriptional regulator [Caldilineaceae bacterium]|nr:TetR/AcrR family transcriptional regulator [Caldilineaceae bacterium]
MNNLQKSDNKARERRILDVTRDLIIRYGYDKMSMNDIADAAGISKGAIYLHFASKDELFEAIFYREFRAYAATWYARILADPQGGTIGGIYQAVLYAVNSNPFITAVVKKDPRVLGTYLRKPNNIFANMTAPGLLDEMVVALQEAGVIRRDLEPLLITHIMDMLSYGLVALPDQKAADAIPPFDDLLATIAEMLDRLLTPPAGADSAAGKRVIAAWAGKIESYFDGVEATQDVAKEDAR